MHLTGIHTALVTPFDATGHVDEQSLRRLINNQLAEGISGFVVAGGTGEGSLLSWDEWSYTLDVVVDATSSRVPVTAHVSASSTAAAVARARTAQSKGAAIAMAHPPYDQPLSEHEVVGYFEAIAAVGLPVMIYNNLSSGSSLSTDTITRLAEIDGVSYLKDSSSDASRMAEIGALTEHSLQVLLGKDTLSLFGFLSGGDATVLGSANAVPRALVHLQKLVAGNRARESAELWLDLLPLLMFFERHSYVAAVKAATILSGIQVGEPRLPATPLQRADVERLSGLLHAVARRVAVVQQISNGRDDDALHR